VAYALSAGEVGVFGKIGTTQADIDRLCKRLQSKARRVNVVYEAGPCGYGLYRQLIQKEFDCMVCAPSLIPRKPGGVTERKPYPTDVSHEEWSFAAPYLTLTNEDAPQRRYELREMVNALRWMARAGASWRMLPTNFPPWELVYQQT
jgi:hypothetical protein